MFPRTNNPKKKIGRTRTAAKVKSSMEHSIVRKAANFKAGVAIATRRFGDGDVGWYPCE
jgi:hypothetical protein